VLLRLMGARRGTSLETGILMASPSETTLIVLAVATNALLIQPGTAQFWQIVTAIGLTITPLLALLGKMIGRKVEPAPALDNEQGDSAAPVVIIVGFGRVGRLVADMMQAHNRPYVAIDSNGDLVDSGRRDGYRVKFGNATSAAALERLGLASAPAVILTMDEHVLAQRLVRKLRAAHPALPIIARARDGVHAAQLYRSGATTAVPETLESSLQLSEAALVEIGVAMGPVIVSIHEKRDEFRESIMREGELEERPKLRTSTLEG
jgi:monovalent cation:H+ antiporter-2, CPA2 family